MLLRYCLRDYELVPFPLIISVSTLFSNSTCAEIILRGSYNLKYSLHVSWSLFRLQVLQRLLTCIVTYLFTPSSRVFLDKLTGSATSQKFLPLYATWRFIAVLIITRHLSLYRARSIQSPQTPHTPWKSILKLNSLLRLGLPNGLFPSGFPTRILCITLPYPISATCPAHNIILDFTTRTILGKGYRSLSTSLGNFLHSHWYAYSLFIITQYAVRFIVRNNSVSSHFVSCCIKTQL
jgi:hypothetical protein